MRLLARNEKNSIVHIEHAGRGKQKYFHLTDRTPMIPRKGPFSAPHFDFDINSERAGKNGVGLMMATPIHEITQLALARIKVWKFQFRGEIYTIHVQRGIDDARLRAGPRFVYVDMVLMLEPASSHYTQFRGNLIVLINSHDPKRQKLDAKRLDYLQSTGRFVVVLDLPMYLCSKKKVVPTQVYLDGLFNSVMGFLESTPTVQMPIKPGWCKGEPISAFHLQNKRGMDAGGLDFAASKKAKPASLSKQPRLLERIASMLKPTG